MITRFAAANFKSVKSLNLTMRPFMVLVGPNGAGKTNVVRALELFGDLLRRGTVDPVREQGYDQLIRRENKPARGGLQLSVTVEIPKAVMKDLAAYGSPDAPPLDSTTIECSVSITGSVKTGDVAVESETLILRSAQRELSLHLESDELKVGGTNDPSLMALFAPRPHPGRVSRALLPQQSFNFALDILNQEDPERRVLRLLSWQRTPLRLMRYVRDKVGVTRLRLDASALRRDSSFEESSRDHLIGPNGEGLAAAVYRLRGEGDKPRPAFGRVLEAIQGVFPRIEDVRAERIQTGRLILTFKERGISQVLDQRSVSDGVLHALALLLALEGGLGGEGLLVIEEPENAIHPWSIRSMMKRAQEMPTRQLLMTTHSETVVNAVEAIDSLFVVENRDGIGTVVASATALESALAAILNESGQKLGDIWMGGGLGGVPGNNP